MKKIGGSISVYTTLVFTCVLALTLTLIESGRYEYCGAYCSVVTKNSVESVMGNYANEVLDKYGLFLNYRSDKELKKELKDYINSNIKGFGDNTVDFLAVAESDLNDVEIKHITDDGGSHMAKQITEYMKYKIGEDGAKALINSYKDSSSLESISEFIKTVKSAKKKIERLADAASDLYDSYEKIKKTAGTIKNDVKGINKAIKNLKETLEEYKDGECEFEDLDRSYNILVGQVSNLEKDFKDIREFAKKASESKKEYTEEKEESESVYESILSGEKAEEEGEDELITNYEDVEDIIEVIDNIDLSDFDKTKKLAEENAAKIIERKLDKLKDYLKKSKEISPLAKEIILNGMEDNPTKQLKKNSGGGISGKDIVKYVESIGEEAYLGLYMDVSTLSNKTVDLYEGCPSRIKDKGSGKIGKVDGAMFSLYSADLLGSYVGLNNQSDDEGRVLDYELEYLLGGKDSDKENLVSTINKLVALREATNMIAILSNPDKLSEVRTLAMMTFGLTGIPAITLLGEVLIIAAWGYAESVMDIRSLLLGGRCKLIKSSKDFSLSLSNIGSIIKGNYGEHVEENGTILDGLNYKEFLELLIYAAPNRDKYYRLMDIIEFDMRKSVSEFKMSDCITGVKINAEYRLKSLFLSEDTVRKFKKNGKVNILRCAEYEY